LLLVLGVPAGLEPVLGVPAGLEPLIGWPDGATSHHLAPKSSRPWPFVSPAALSSAK
jgi:hypothetical protein